jgi:hypothetical protein
LPAGIELTAPPVDMSVKLQLELGGAVELLGAKLTPTQGLKPGSRVELTLLLAQEGGRAAGLRALHPRAGRSGRAHPEFGCHRATA